MKCGWNIFVRDLNNEQGENRLTDVVKKGIIEPSSADSVDKKIFQAYNWRTIHLRAIIKA